MLIPIAAIASLAVVFGLLLGYSAIRFKVVGDPVADQIDALLPQSQCGQCGYPGCRPYAEAVAGGAAEIHLCAPGGEATMLALADLLGREPVAGDAVAVKARCVAVIDERACIGCTLCQQACPVDAVVGAAKQLHGVLASECTGCELCIKPCPVGCISMVPVPQTIATWKWPYPNVTPLRRPEPAPTPAPTPASAAVAAPVASRALAGGESAAAADATRTPEPAPAPREQAPPSPPPAPEIEHRRAA